MRLFLIVFLLFAPGSAVAGAWLREQGTGFLSTYVLQRQTGDSEVGLYMEYGFRPQLTLGLKLDGNITTGYLSNGSALVFGRKPIPRDSKQYKLSYTIGLGADQDTETKGFIRTQLSYGRGLTVGQRNGWIALDAIYDWSVAGQSDTIKLDSTIGLTMNPRYKLMMQVFVSHTDDTAIKVAPSVVWQPGGADQSYQFGLEAEAGEVALRFGLWREF